MTKPNNILKDDTLLMILLIPFDEEELSNQNKFQYLSML